jgi:hypothetical protein
MALLERRGQRSAISVRVRSASMRACSARCSAGRTTPNW